MTYYPRRIEPVLRRAAGQFRVVALSGARQTGKSTLLRRLFRKTHRYVSLDNPRDLKLAQEDPELFFREYSGPLLLDEIQYAPQLLSHIKIRVDQKQTKGCCILTSSQQFTLIKNLHETLAGRVGLFQLLPMALSEGKASTRNYEFRALVGSYPELVASPRPDPERWFASYLSTYIERDVQTHFRLEKITHFRDLMFLLAARTGQLLNYQSLANDLGVSVPAVKLWVRVLEISQILYLLRPYYVNLGSRIVKAPKIYFSDCGLASYLTGTQGRKALVRGPLAGALFENFVIQEILKHYFNQGKTPPLFYYRTNNGLEVDLLIERRPGVLIPCEIKLNRTPHAGMAASIARLRRLNKKKILIEPGYLIAPLEGSFPLTREVRACGLGELLHRIH